MYMFKFLSIAVALSCTLPAFAESWAELEKMLPPGVYRGRDHRSGGECFVWVRKDERSFSVLVHPTFWQEGTLSGNFLMYAHEELHCVDAGTYICNVSFFNNPGDIREIRIRKKSWDGRIDVMTDIRTRNGNEHTKAACLIRAPSPFLMSSN